MELELYGDYVVLSDVCDEGDPIVQEAVSVIKERVTLAIQEAGLSALEWDTTVEVRKVEQYSDEGKSVFNMPLKYRKEMLADWIGAGKAQGKPDTKAWYEANKDKMQLHPETRKWIETALGVTQEK